MTELAGYIDGALPYYLNLIEEQMLLAGDGVSPSLYGLIPQASAFNSTLLSGSRGWTPLDILLEAKAQIAVAKELPPTFAIVHPTDWYGMCGLKNSLGNYILSDPASMTRPRVWSLDVVPTISIAQGTWLVGSGSMEASEIRDRQSVVIELSTSHASFFTANLVAIKADKRLCLCTKRAASYVTGSFSSSPSA